MQGSTSALIRVMPLNSPVMHPVQVRTHTFFVPNRILWEGWEDFITGGNDGLGEGNVLPTTNPISGLDNKLNYLGVPPYPTLEVSQLPLRAYNKIFNEWYRDQDLVPEIAEDQDGKLEKVAWEKDYFTTARPWTQRGPDVTLPLGNKAPVYSEGQTGENIGIWAEGDDYSADPRYMDVSDNLRANLSAAASAFPANGLYADLSAAGAINVNDFRMAFALQRYQEARARYGARFTEYLRFLGITPSDARLQRPEYLGGGATRLSFSEVLQTTPTPDRTEPQDRDDIGVGDMYGHGIAGLRTGKWRRFFEEHGYVITLLSVRPKSIYTNVVPREFLKRTKEDFFQKELQALGQQEIYQQEIHGGAADATEVFGFQDRYQEYRFQPSQVGQDFRSLVNTFHLGREFQSTVSLNKAFIDCEPSRRIFQIEDDAYDTLWCMVNNHLVARRMVPKRANPRIL